MYSQKFRNIMRRYSGQQVVVHCYGHQKFVGMIKDVFDDFILLTNTVQFGELDNSQWQEQLTLDSLAESNTGLEETVLSINSITSISCDNPNLESLDDSTIIDELDVVATESTQAKKDSCEPKIHSASRFQIRLGVELQSLIAPDHFSPPLPERIRRLRKELVRTLGFEITKAHIVDDVVLSPNSYQVLSGGHLLGQDKLYPDEKMVILPGKAELELDGRPVREPAFNLDSIWLRDPKEIAKAEEAQCTVVDSLGVLITHLGELARRFPDRLLTYQSVCVSLTELESAEPTLVKEHFDSAVSKMWLFQVLLELLKSRVWIGDFQSIAQSVALHLNGPRISLKDLVANVRRDIGYTLLHHVSHNGNEYDVIAMEPGLEHLLGDQSELSPNRLERFIRSFESLKEQALCEDRHPCLIVDNRNYEKVTGYLARVENPLPILRYQEFPRDVRISPCGILKLDEIDETTAAELPAPNPEE